MLAKFLEVKKRANGSTMCLALVLMSFSLALSSCDSGPKAPEGFLTRFYIASSESPADVMAMLDSDTLPSGDGNARVFTDGIVKATQARYRSHGGIQALEGIKLWQAQRNSKYTGYSATLRFKDGAAQKMSGYLTKEGGNWRMTTASRQD